MLLPGALGAQSLLYVSSLSTDGSTIVTTYNTADRTVAASTPQRAGAMALSPDGRTVYIVDANGSTVVGTPAGAATILGGANTGGAPVSAAVSPNGNTLLVANQQGGSVTFANARTFVVAATVNVGFSPSSVVIHPEGEEAFVAQQNGGDVAVLALTGAPRVLRRFVAGVAPVALAFLDANQLLVLDAAAEEIIRVNRATGAREGTFDAGPEPAAIALARGRVYVSNAADTTIRMFNPATGAAMGTIQLPNCPWPRCAVMSLAVSPDGNTLFAASSNTNQVHAVNLADNTVATTYTVPSGPRWLLAAPVPPRN